jgi:formate dehydrogenase subunit gamma
MLEQNEHSGRKILRFNTFERFTHWMTATCFIILALTGLNYIFGKRLLMPLIGPDAFSAITQWSKYAHNFLAWPFIIGLCFMMAVWLADNIPNRVDWAWLKAGGGFFGDRHPSAGRFNAGQKIVFWVVILGGLLMSISGILLLFPFAALDINGMQTIQGIHAVIGVLFIAAMLAHVYIGSLGMEGAYDAMGSGEVDLAWARAHHDLWVEEQQAKTASGPQVPSRPLPAE